VWDLWGLPEITADTKNTILQEAGFVPSDNPRGGILCTEWKSHQATHRKGTGIIAASTDIHTCPKFAISKKVILDTVKSV
jgi:hypothetical protein